MALGVGGQVLFKSDEKDAQRRHCASPGVQGARQQPQAWLLYFCPAPYKNLKVHVIVAALDGNHGSDWAVSVDPDTEWTLTMLPASGELSSGSVAKVLRKEEDLREGPQQLCRRPGANDSGWGNKRIRSFLGSLLSPDPNNEGDSHRERHPLLT